jgi:16S rRNA (adenine1518-N6/adenine1519-N6)-dimethyltransferase
MNYAQLTGMLDRHGFRFSKSMGQNFLIDENIPEKIVRLSGADETCGVLEAGPGAGVLTLELSRVAGRVTAVEMDRRLLPVLDETLADCENVDIVPGDILKLDLAQLVTEKMPGMKYLVCANLPYNITTPAIAAFINADVFISLTVMVQREVARRICAEPGNPDYGAFSVFVQYHTEPQLLFDVSPECFIPRPNVVSSVVNMKSRSEKALNPDYEALFFKIVKAAFGQRRKTLVNALLSAFGDTLGKEKLTDIINSCDFDARIRGETLGIEDFARLTETLAGFVTIERQNGDKKLKISKNLVDKKWKL